MKIKHQQNEKHRQMKIHEEQQQQQQNEDQQSTSQKPPEVLPSKYHCWKFLTFDDYCNYYMVIDDCL